MANPPDPNDGPTEEIDRRRGAILSLWAAIESSIDRANHYGWLYSKKTVSQVVPQNLRWKIQTFKKINRDLLPFEPLREAAAELLDWIERRYDDRHWMAHGYLLPWECGKDSWGFVKHEFLGNGSIKDLNRTFTRDELVEITNDLCQLAWAMGHYSRHLAEQVLKHAPDNESG